MTCASDPVAGARPVAGDAPDATGGWKLDAASPEERAAVLGIAPAHLDCGVDRGRIAEMRRVAADHQRKSERENP